MSIVVHFENIQRVKDHHGLKEYTVLECVSDRHKTSAYQNLKMFPHNSEMAYCAYFSLAHYLVLDKNPESDYLFHNYADKVISEKGDDDPKVARDWADVLTNVVVNPYNHYKEEYGRDNNTLKKSNVENLNENLTLHCG